MKMNEMKLTATEKIGTTPFEEAYHLTHVEEVEEVYLIQLEGGVFQITVPRDKPFEDWEYTLINALKESPDFLWLGDGKFIVSKVSEVEE